MKREGQAANLRATTLEQIRSIQADRSLSAEGKGRQIAALRKAANDQIAQLRADHERERSERQQSAYRKAFGLSFKSSASDSDRILQRISYRDAIFRVDGIQSQSDAASILNRARITGDKDLERAIGLKAYQSGWRNVLQDFAQGSPDIADALGEIAQMQDASTANVHASMHFSKLSETPEERSLQTIRSAA